MTTQVRQVNRVISYWHAGQSTAAGLAVSEDEPSSQRTPCRRRKFDRDSAGDKPKAAECRDAQCYEITDDTIHTVNSSDLAPMTNFCLINLHVLMIVNLSSACFTETAIDYCICP